MYKDFINLSVIDFAQQIRTSPSNYFGKHIKLSLLDTMLFGYNLNSQKESEVPFQYFNYWVKKKLNKFGSKYDWSGAILESCNNDEEKAFWKFYELLDQFITLRPKQLFIAELNPENLSYYYSKENTDRQVKRIIGGDNKYIITPAPYHVKVFEFNYCVHSYHFDYYWLVEEYDKNIYYRHFDDLTECKKFYTSKFNLTEWALVKDSEIQDNYFQTIKNCRNRRQHII